MIDGGSVQQFQTAEQRVIRRPPTNIGGAFVQIAHDQLHQGLRHFRESLAFFFGKPFLQCARIRLNSAKILRSVGCLRGKILYLGCHHGKSLACIARSRRFDGCIECKKIDLARDSFIHEQMIFDPPFYSADDVFDVRAAHVWTLFCETRQGVKRTS